MTLEFRPWPKTPRLSNSGMVITEKIDGTNAAVIITEDGEVGAQSRNRLITPESDNFGFAKWVYENEHVLFEILGPGYHYGEWWGSGIQRGYGLEKGEKRFSLFNTGRWDADDIGGLVPGLGVVPVLRIHQFDTAVISEVVEDLRANGSYAAPGFMRPEGVIVYVRTLDKVLKVLIENNDIPKGVAA
ncbi:RNA ligase family protein [Mycobacterium paragordonae]|uniref:RNA ligase family protein n=1 Tax=Mycobacterium paragordonae TaxID=1389713 RepID=A0AAJ1S2K6_9MYCO|nr:RNA ligase family protein [Mycobacterium paragordonae]MDP7733689.1 RNA ligase family protein [Mycobacterium paragordonae]